MHDIYLRQVCDFIASKKEWYGKRFGYSACELWLCVEACNILNFDSDTSFANNKENKCCFNEDGKRDLSIYDDELNIIASHIEVKVLYPSYGHAKSKNKIKEVFDKFNMDDSPCSENLHGWFFLIWSSMNKGSFSSPEDFFAKNIQKIEDLVIVNNKFAGNRLETLPFLKETFKWRDTEKEIIVQAVSVKNTIKELGKTSFV